MNRKPTKSEVREFTEVQKWTISHPGTYKKCNERCSFAEIEYKYFEGFNLPFRTGYFGTEAFEKAIARMKRYYELDYESHRELREFKLKNK